MRNNAKMKPREIIKERRKKVKQLYFVQRYTQEEIAKALGWGNRTIWKDIRKLREQTFKSFKPEELKDLAINHIEEFNKIIQSLWKEYHNTDNPRFKASLLERLSRVLAEERKMLQELGLMFKKADEIQIIEDKYEEDIKWAKKYLIKKRKDINK